jgi:hypothetical protein
MGGFGWGVQAGIILILLRKGDGVQYCIGTRILIDLGITHNSLKQHSIIIQKVH